MARIHPKVLLVEGDRDIWVILNLIKKHGIFWNKNEEALIRIEYPGHPNKEAGGKDNLLKPKFIASYLEASGRTALGLMVDADEDATGCWQRIKNACLQNIPSIPDEIPNAGLVLNTQNSVGDPVRFGVWIMPDNQRRGMIETFLAELIPNESEPLWQYAQDVTVEAKMRGAPFTNAHKDKANIYSWLAWQDPPGLELRVAIEKQMLDPHYPKAQAFMAWFKRLYEL